MIVTRKQSIEHRLTDLMTKAEKQFVHDGKVVLPRVVVSTMEDAWVALCRDRDFDRAEHLIEVVSFLIAREKARFTADRKRWIERQEIAA
jgi:hypothetical protein